MAFVPMIGRFVGFAFSRSPGLYNLLADDKRRKEACGLGSQAIKHRPMGSGE